MPDLRELAGPHLDSPVRAAALYRLKRPQHAYPIMVHGLVFLPVLAEGLVKLLIRKSRETRGVVQSPDPRTSAVPLTAAVLLGVGDDQIAMLVVRSRLQGWTERNSVGTFSRSAIHCNLMNGEPFGMQLVLPDNSVLRLRPMYATTDAEEIARIMLHDAH